MVESNTLVSDYAPIEFESNTIFEWRNNGGFANHLLFSQSEIVLLSNASKNIISGEQDKECSKQRLLNRSWNIRDKQAVSEYQDNF